MRLDIRGRAFAVTSALDRHVNRRLRFAVGRFGPRVHRVVVRLGDDNGPRGGVDKVCRVVATTRAGTCVVEAVDRDLYRAIDRATERTGRAVGRALARARAAH